MSNSTSESGSFQLKTEKTLNATINWRNFSGSSNLTSIENQGDFNLNFFNICYLFCYNKILLSSLLCERV